MHAVLTSLHALAAAVWVGGMFFAYMVLRKASAAQLAPPERLQLWNAVCSAFFRWVWLAIALLLVTGTALILLVYRGAWPGAWLAYMIGAGLVMMLLFGHVYFAPFRRLQEAVAAQDWPAAGAALGSIRATIGINLILGISVLLAGAGGRFW
ncbi:MAG: hypothetical protein HKO62_01845 [Gammaproteobacteria bacterium]|nr:CopD family protein [Gammaproteobacteria bacterium]NNL99463.1 hypothetical protein [Gammaproteobacteria bacterium]